MLFISVGILTIATIALLSLLKSVSPVVFLSVLFLALHMQSTILTRFLVDSKVKGLININDSSAFGATLVALVGVGAYLVAGLLTTFPYIQGVLVAVPVYFAQSFNQEVILGLK